MIVSGYSIAVYCDCKKCSTESNDDGSYFMPHYTDAAGESFSDCARQLKYAGWVLHKKDGKCYAPGHLKK